MHYSRVAINGRPFESVADSIYLAHKANNETNVKVGFVSTIAAFFQRAGAQVLANMVHLCILEQPLAHG